MGQNRLILKRSAQPPKRGAEADPFKLVGIERLAPRKPRSPAAMVFCCNTLIGNPGIGQFIDQKSYEAALGRSGMLYLSPFLRHYPRQFNILRASAAVAIRVPCRSTTSAAIVTSSALPFASRCLEIRMLSSSPVRIASARARKRPVHDRKLVLPNTGSRPRRIW